jgi:hypothetical protein
MRGRNNNGGSGGSGGGSGSGNNNNNNNNNNGRKGPNPLTRNYESNGPDVKIRGSAQQIAEKYATLARDAHSAGDRVMSENYLQHAEHYNRIIAAAQAQMPIQQVQNNRDDFDDEDQDRDDFDNVGNNQHGNVQQHNAQHHNAQASEAATASVVNNDGSGPQPIIEGMPAEVALNSEAAGENVSARGDNRGRGRGRRPAPSQAQPQDQPVEQTQPAAVVADDAGAPDVTSDQEEVAAAPRRGRRPRRGERQPVEGAGAEAAATEAPAADAPGDDTALATAANG